jgi:hypothetical protein
MSSELKPSKYLVTFQLLSFLFITAFAFGLANIMGGILINAGLPADTVSTVSLVYGLVVVFCGVVLFLWIVFKKYVLRKNDKETQSGGLSLWQR